MFLYKMRVETTSDGNIKYICTHNIKKELERNVLCIMRCYLPTRVENKLIILHLNKISDP